MVRATVALSVVIQEGSHTERQFPCKHGIFNDSILVPNNLSGWFSRVKYVSSVE